MAAKTDLLIEQGTSWTQSWRIVNFDLYDGTVWTIQSQIRRTACAEAVLHDFAAEGQATISDDIVTLRLDPATSSGWIWNRGVYDVEMHGDDGRVYRIAEGEVRVSAEVTRE